MTDKYLKELNARINRKKLYQEFNKISKFYSNIPLYTQVQLINKIKNNKE